MNDSLLIICIAVPVMLLIFAAAVWPMIRKT